MKRFSELEKKQKITLIIACALLVVCVSLAVALPLALKGNAIPSTEYDTVKRTKMENFTFLNATAEHGQVVLIGDSITEIYPNEDLFSDYTRETGKLVYNRGISGDTSDRMLERLNANALAIKPSHLVILIGTNDYRHADNAQIAANIEAAVKKTKEICPETKIILEAVYPINKAINPSMVGGRSNESIAELNALIEAVAAKYSVAYLDLTDSLSDADGNFNAAYTYDGLHPNARGYAVVTEKLLPLLK